MKAFVYIGVYFCLFAFTSVASLILGATKEITFTEAWYDVLSIYGGIGAGIGAVLFSDFVIKVIQGK